MGRISYKKVTEFPTDCTLVAYLLGANEMDHWDREAFIAELQAEMQKDREALQRILYPPQESQPQ